ncbi:hypothetical protein BS47DRAFT_1385083 [Hydnum rufescens UP504]|uniref:Uncharacterized protein n=1 Tax=Hydnum rufescens UP504 TaxID=1448309 RepID=A0A9P6ALL8_9AGAM|nr:hypothetical protein BS47DRAFT_1385083 [Hydnum rufescens UP504]
MSKWGKPSGISEFRNGKSGREIKGLSWPGWATVPGACEPGYPSPGNLRKMALNARIVDRGKFWSGVGSYVMQKHGQFPLTLWLQFLDRAIYGRGGSSLHSERRRVNNGTRQPIQPMTDMSDSPTVEVSLIFLAAENELETSKLELDYSQ